MLRRILVLIIGLLLILVAVSIIYKVRWISSGDSFETVATGFEKTPALIVVNREGGLDIIRMNDNKKQSFDGNWRAMFIAPTRVAVFGEFTGAPNKHTLFLFDTSTGKQIDVSSLPGKITHVSANPRQTYLLINGVVDSESQDSYSCVADLSSIPLSCVNIVTELLGQPHNASGPYIAWWNQEKDHEILIIRGEDAYERYAMDMWDDVRPREVSSKVIEHALQIFEMRKDSSRNGVMFLKRSGPFVRVTDKKTGEYYSVLVAPWHEVLQVSPDTFVAVGKKSATFVNTQTKYRFTIPLDSDARVQTYFGDL